MSEFYAPNTVVIVVDWISTGNVKEVKSNGNVYGQYNDGILDIKITFDFVLNNVYIPELGKNYIAEDKKITKVTADYFVFNRLELFSYNLLLLYTCRFKIS